MFEKIKEHLIEEKFNYILILFLIINISFNIYGIFNETTSLKSTTQKEMLEEVVEQEKISIPSTINVDVKGLVNSPGVYEVEEGTIVNEIIELAGGLSKNATTANINLSKKVTNEMIIIVYSASELKKLKNASTDSISCSTYNIENCNSNNNSIIETGKSTVSNEKISINTATKDQLMSLPGIGEVKANSIISYRSEQKFESIEDIKKVSGIGDSVFDSIKDYITI